MYLLPFSSFTRGEENQDLLIANTFKIAPFICYEIVYADLVARNIRDAQIIITSSNDAWFGSSIGPLQHFQIAQMRALENNRYVIRATNTGISGVIGPDGKIISLGEPFVRDTLSAQAQLLAGKTPFAHWGSWPIVLFSLGIICIIAWRQSSGGWHVTGLVKGPIKRPVKVPIKVPIKSCSEQPEAETQLTAVTKP